jgi:SpoIIAA-like
VPQSSEDRIRFITHKGNQILLIDATNCSSKQLEEMSRLVPSYVTAEPKGSVLLLADVTGAKLDKKAMELLKPALVLDRPHVTRSAWVGTESIPKVFFEQLKAFSQRDLPSFKTREEALEWLVEE